MSAPSPQAAAAKLARLPDERLDVVGDVHGELMALHALLAELGYDRDGRHPDGRRLVFVGDLCDRGPESPAVLEFVMQLHAAGRAWCVLGNHELNLLRGARKEGNGWFHADDHDRRRGLFLDSRPVDAGARGRILAFLARLPLALVRDDLRIVHAAWHEPSLDRLGGELAAQPYAWLYDEYAGDAEAAEERSRLARRAQLEREAWGHLLADRDAEVPLLEGIGRCDAHYQMSNPLRVITSGIETLARAPFYASGKWRMVDRVPWWKDYHGDVPVLFGHYWRLPEAAARDLYGKSNPDPFAGEPAYGWLGPRDNAYCMDFSVGARFLERVVRPQGPWLTQLAAVRWPEREVVFEGGERHALG